jgi:hypothetical protein
VSPPIAFVNSSQHLKGYENLLRIIADACSLQIAMHVAPAWGRTPAAVTFEPNPTHLPFGARVVWFRDKLDAPDALGYHTETARGVVYGVVGVDVVLAAPGATALAGPDSLMAVASHEAVELFLNPDVNLLVRGPDGMTYDVEGCDWVEGDCYEASARGSDCSLSNFLYPDAFDCIERPHAGRRFDHMDRLLAPFTMTDGGYMPRSDAQGNDATVYGERMPAWKLAEKRRARRAKKREQALHGHR